MTLLSLLLLVNAMLHGVITLAYVCRIINKLNFVIKIRRITHGKISRYPYRQRCETLGVQG